MRIHKPPAIFSAALAGLSVALAGSEAAAQCNGSNCERVEQRPPARQAPPRQAPPQNRPAAPPTGERPAGAPQPGSRPGGVSPGGGYGAYRPDGPSPQQRYRPNAAAQQGYRPNAYSGGGSVRPPNEGFAGPRGTGRAPAYSATRRFNYQGRSFSAVRAAPYHYPRGYGYRTFHPHERFPLALLVAPYFIGDFALYNLPPPEPDLEWVRYGPDALLVNVDTGEVVDVAYGVFEEDPSYASDYGPGGYGEPDYPPSDESEPPPDYAPGGYPPPSPAYGYPPPGGPED
ncbi:MAG TPA: RcnB family protein [Caulobacteraceae bacterium]|jgi:Ni/Co efflux regulator RcnB